MPLQRSPPPASQQVQTPSTPSNMFSTPQPLYTPHSSSEPSLNTNTDSPTNTMPCAITYRNTKRKRFDGEEDDRLTTFMSDMKQMFLDFKQQQEEKYDLLCGMVDNIRATVDEMCEKYNRLNLRLDSFESESKENTSLIKKMEAKLEYIEQSSRSTCLEIRNVPVMASETKTSLLNTVVSTGTLLNIGLQPNDIKDVFRIKSKDPANRTIIVDFTTVLCKELFLTNFRKHGRQSFKITTEHLKISGPVKPIYISENLTAKKKRLFYLARDAAKSNDYRFCWVKNGKIFVRRQEASKHIEIKCEEDLPLIVSTA